MDKNSIVLPNTAFTSASDNGNPSTISFGREYTPFTQLLPTRVCFTNAGVNTYGAEIHKVRKHAIYAFPSFLFIIILVRLYVKKHFSEM